MSTWVPINDYPGDQRYDDIPGTANLSFWAEIGTDHPSGWTWTIICIDDHGYTDDYDGGKADTEDAAKHAVETWTPPGLL